MISKRFNLSMQFNSCIMDRYHAHFLEACLCLLWEIRSGSSTSCLQIGIASLFDLVLAWKWDPQIQKLVNCLLFLLRFFRNPYDMGRSRNCREVFGTKLSCSLPKWDPYLVTLHSSMATNRLAIDSQWCKKIKKARAAEDPIAFGGSSGCSPTWHGT